jgi:hypothetical protein
MNMNTLIYCRTMDEVNAALAEQWCEEQGLAFRPADPRDALFPADADGLVIDLDHLSMSPGERADFLDGLAMHLRPYPVAVASYHLDLDDVAMLESRGVLVCRGMDEDVIGKLAAVIEQARNPFAA